MTVPVIEPVIGRITPVQTSARPGRLHTLIRSVSPGTIFTPPDVIPMVPKVGPVIGRMTVLLPHTSDHPGSFQKPVRSASPGAIFTPPDIIRNPEPVIGQMIAPLPYTSDRPV